MRFVTACQKEQQPGPFFFFFLRGPEEADSVRARSTTSALNAPPPVRGMQVICGGGAASLERIALGPSPAALELRLWMRLPRCMSGGRDFCIYLLANTSLEGRFAKSFTMVANNSLDFPDRESTVGVLFVQTLWKSSEEIFVVDTRSALDAHDGKEE